MDDAVDAVAGEYLVKLDAVAHIRLVKGDGPARYLLNAFACLGAAVNKIINDDDIHALLQKLNAGVAADIAHSAGDQNRHKDNSFTLSESILY